MPRVRYTSPTGGVFVIDLSAEQYAHFKDSSYHELLPDDPAAEVPAETPAEVPADPEAPPPFPEPETATPEVLATET